MKKPSYLKIYEQAVEQIENGFYESGQKIASIRTCAKEFGVSNTTVELAYQRLAEEGYVTPKHGSGYIVSRPIVRYASSPTAVPPEVQKELDALSRSEQDEGESNEIDFEFWYDAVDATYFPFRAWARVNRKVLLEAGTKSISSNDYQGLYALREEIARYLTSEYAIRCIPEQIMIAASAHALVDEIISLFDPVKTTIGVENPGFKKIFLRLQKEGFTIKPLPMIPAPTWEDALPYLEGTDVICMTPVSQFPTNRAVPTAIREQMVKWANETHTYLIDDGYCREFEIGNPRPPALAALDTGGYVISLGTFSNSFAPSICLSYAVLPPSLMMAWKERGGMAYPSVPWQTQASMAEFMSNGDWIDHVRRTRTAVLRKRAMVIDAIHTYLDSDFDVVEGENSLFVLVKAHDGRSEQELIEAAAPAGARVYPTSQYWYTTPLEDWRYVLIGFAGIPEFKIESGIKTLAKAWGVRTPNRRSSRKSK